MSVENLARYLTNFLTYFAFKSIHMLTFLPFLTLVIIPLDFFDDEAACKRVPGTEYVFDE